MLSTSRSSNRSRLRSGPGATHTSPPDGNDSSVVAGRDNIRLSHGPITWSWEALAPDTPTGRSPFNPSSPVQLDHRQTDCESQSQEHRDRSPSMRLASALGQATSHRLRPATWVGRLPTSCLRPQRPRARPTTHSTLRESAPRHRARRSCRRYSSAVYHLRPIAICIDGQKSGPGVSAQRKSVFGGIKIESHIPASVSAKIERVCTSSIRIDVNAGEDS